jgi:carbamoyltransferase
MDGALLGPAFSDEQCALALDRTGARYERLDEAALLERVAVKLADGRVVGWVQGRMEFGPRALGSRSILADPRSPTMQSRINRKVKFRESFRPFAPAVLAERAAEYFELPVASPYMLIVAPVRQRGDHERLPAITHVDGSARVQTVDATGNPRFRQLLEAFAAQAGCPILVNTSFNLGGEPIVCTPEDAYDAFMRTELDDLVVGNLLLVKADQPARAEAGVRHAPDAGVSARSLLLRAADALRRFLTSLVLGFVYFLVVLPTGLIRRLRGRDAMRRQFDPAAASYRVATRHRQRPELGKPW